MKKVQIADVHRAYAEAMQAARTWAERNPGRKLSDNPFRIAVSQLRIASGCPSPWTCDCGTVVPKITEDLKTGCCGLGHLNVNL